ncbi:hypothetical protein GCM10008101_04860 [Lysobacter xinjiangensis]|uniref:Uncharacterized protein n=1 Tax=Cognatilysobacter xinjiangensis TaxID=546892 RepID=A0ABQ3BQU2_9GAMM|nr:hypothetical protein [Lysobacter xinjiangensis]GGZ54604.1 hypothetical protein GCM10008101_04860 [Lysobacter xinjiangensis]
MKVQFESGRLRLRVGNAELAALRAGDTLAVALDWPGRPWRLALDAGDSLGFEITARDVTLALPRADLDALAARLPARDGLRYALELPSGPLELRFEVDLHDGRVRPR